MKVSREVSNAAQGYPSCTQRKPKMNPGRLWRRGPRTLSLTSWHREGQGTTGIHRRPDPSRGLNQRGKREPLCVWTFQADRPQLEVADVDCKLLCLCTKTYLLFPEWIIQFFIYLSNIYLNLCYVSGSIPGAINRNVLVLVLGSLQLG